MPLAATTNEIWSFQGTTLNMPFWNLTTFGGSRWDLPALRGQNYTVAYRAGQLQRAKMPDSRVITLVMWTAGIDTSLGIPAADQELAFNQNFYTLRRLFWTRGAGGSQQGALQRNWWLGQQGSGALQTATAYAEIAGTMEPTMTGRTRADFSVDLLLADPFFYGAQQSNTITTSGGTITNPGDDFAGFGWPNGGTPGAPAAQTPFTITFNSPGGNVVLTNTTWNVSVSTSYSGTSLTLDVLNYTALDAGSVSRLGTVSHAGARPWMVLGPGANVFTLSGATNAVFTWYPPYL